MGIVSISLNEENLAALDRIQKVYGLSGRSEAVRTSINAALADIRELEGIVEGVLVIVRGNHADPWMSMIQARHESVIRTQMHSHLQNHKCLEVMVVSCDAGTLTGMLKEIQAEGKADYVKFVRG